MLHSSRSPRAPRGAVLPALVVSLLVALVVSPAAPAAAHDELLETTPADGSTVGVVPHEVVLRFSGNLLDLSQEVIVTAPDGTQLTGLTVTVERNLATAALPDGLGAGAYTVAWRVVSGDGHPIQGRFGFTAAGGSAASSAPPLAVDTGPAATSTATVKAVPSPSVAAGDVPTPAPSAVEQAASPSGSSGTALGWVAAAVVAALAVTAGLLVRRRHGRPARTTPRP